jgi:heme exporter protein CcmD
MSPDPHLSYIIAAYALAFVIVAGMIGAILVDYMRLKQSLASLAALDRRERPDMRDFTHQRFGQRYLDPEGSE